MSTFRKQLAILALCCFFGPKMAAEEPGSDQEFVAWAIRCETAEIKFAEHALKQAGKADVKKLARTALEQHIKLREVLLDRARQMRAPFTEDLDRSQRDTFERIVQLEGADFDREYLRFLIDRHEKGVQMCMKWARDARDPALRDIAERVLLLMKDHLNQAREIAARVRS